MNKKLDNPAVAVICLIVVPAFLGLLFMMGKTNVPLSKFRDEVYKLNWGGCCSQALLYPRNQVPALVEYLRRVKSGQTDMMVEDYAGEMGKQ